MTKTPAEHEIFAAISVCIREVQDLREQVTTMELRLVGMLEEGKKLC